MPKKARKKIKVKNKTAVRKSRVSVKKKQQQPEVMFDSQKPSTDFLFANVIPANAEGPVRAGIQSESTEKNLDSLFQGNGRKDEENIVTFADYKAENFDKIKAELQNFGAIFCSESDLPETPYKIKEKGFFKKMFKGLFGSLLIGLIFAGMFSAFIYVMALPYSPGETTNPSCSPGDADCTVTASVPYTGATAAVNLGARTLTTTGAGSLGSLTLTTSALTVGNGGIGISTIAAGSILGANVLDTLAAVTSTSGTKVLTNTAGTMTWETAVSGMTNPMDAIGQIIYGGASGAATKLVAGTSGQILQSGGAAAPAWTTATYPATTTANSVLYSTATNVVGDNANLTFDGTNLAVGGVGDSQILSTSGSLILGGTENTNNESLTFDFETISNEVALTSATGATVLNLGTIGLSSGSYISGTPIITSTVASGPPLTTPADGAMIIDSGDDGRLYIRYGSAWHYIAATAGFQIPNFEITDPISGEEIQEGDVVLGMINKTLSDGALHGIWVKWDSVKEDLLAEARGEVSKLGTMGNGKVDGVKNETTKDKVANILNSLGISIKDGVTKIATLAVEKSTTNVARINKMEMVDSSTGEIYCAWIKDGEWVKTKGECGSLAVVNAEVQPTLQQEAEQQAQNLVQQAQQIVEQSQQAIEQSANEAVQEAAEKVEEKVDEKIEEKAKAPAAKTSEVLPSTSEVTEPAAEPNPISEIIQESAAGLLNSIWDFITGIFSAGWSFGIKKTPAGLLQGAGSEVSFLQNGWHSALKLFEKVGKKW